MGVGDVYMSRDYNVRRLKRSDKSSFVQLMATSFENDPLFIYLFKEGKRDQEFQEHIDSFVSFIFDKSFCLMEEVWGMFDQNSLIGAYIIETPQVKRGHKIYGGFMLVGTIIKLLKKLSFNSIIKLNRYMKVSRRNVPKVPLHYLIMIGVTPAEQGKGIGGILLQQIMKQVRNDQRSLGIALDTENKRNISYYNRFGFNLYSESKFDDITIYSMFKRIDHEDIQS